MRKRHFPTYSLASRQPPAASRHQRPAQPGRAHAADSAGGRPEGLPAPPPLAAAPQGARLAHGFERCSQTLHAPQQARQGNAQKQAQPVRPGMPPCASPPSANFKNKSKL